jgi:hypothetical protein
LPLFESGLESVIVRRHLPLFESGLDAQWYDDDYWTNHWHAWKEWDRQIDEFNERTGLLERYLRR